jgi:hypothetical protein
MIGMLQMKRTIERCVASFMSDLRSIDRATPSASFGFDRSGRL